VDNTESQNIISFCTGYGGLELGLRRISPNFRTVCYVEIEAFAVANLVSKIEQGKMDAAPVWTDIKTFPAQMFRDKVHGFLAGYPCQPFSNAGKRQGKKDPRHLWPYILDNIRTIRPVWCFFENVSGHLNLGFDEVYKSLRDLGYKVEAGLFTAAEVGAPHKRERLFILAYADVPKPRRNSRTNRSEAEDLRRKNAGDVSTGHDKSDRESANPERTERKPADNTRTGRKGYADDGNDRWPAKPGQEQYDWEEPRTVKPRMGRTVDGFASRVDELRLLGNGVVPAQAELALRTLLKKKKES